MALTQPRSTCRTYPWGVLTSAELTQNPNLHPAMVNLRGCAHPKILLQEYFLMALSQPRSTYRIDEGPNAQPPDKSNFKSSKDGSEGHRARSPHTDLDPDDMSDSEVRADIERENGGLDGVQGRKAGRSKRAFLSRLVSCFQTNFEIQKPHMSAIAVITKGGTQQVGFPVQAGELPQNPGTMFHVLASAKGGEGGAQQVGLSVQAGGVYRLNASACASMSESCRPPCDAEVRLVQEHGRISLTMAVAGTAGLHSRPVS